MEDRATGDDLVCFMIPHLSAVIAHQVFYQSLFTSFLLMTCSVDDLHQSLFICHSTQLPKHKKCNYLFNLILFQTHTQN